MKFMHGDSLIRKEMGKSASRRRSQSDRTSDKRGVKELYIRRLYEQ